MAEITACKENMSEQKADGSPAKKKIGPWTTCPTKATKKGRAAREGKRDQEYKNRVVAAQPKDVCMQTSKVARLTVGGAWIYRRRARRLEPPPAVVRYPYGWGRNSLLVVAVDLPDVETHRHEGGDSVRILRHRYLPHPAAHRARHCPHNHH